MPSLVCGSCSTDYNGEDHKPVVLGCGESVCEKCIKKCIEEKSTLVCPTCVEENESSKLSSFPINFTVLDLLKDNGGELRIIANKVRGLQLRKEQQKVIYNTLIKYHADNITTLNNINKYLIKQTETRKLNNSQLDKENLNPNILNKNIKNKLNYNEWKQGEEKSKIYEKINLEPDASFQETIMDVESNEQKMTDSGNNETKKDNPNSENLDNNVAMSNLDKKDDILNINVLKLLSTNFKNLFVRKLSEKPESKHSKLVLSNGMVHLHSLQKTGQCSIDASTFSFKFDDIYRVMTKQNVFVFIDFKLNGDRQERIYIKMFNSSLAENFIKYSLNFADKCFNDILKTANISFYKTPICDKTSLTDNIYNLSSFFGETNDDNFLEESDEKNTEENVRTEVVKPTLIDKLRKNRNMDSVIITTKSKYGVFRTGPISRSVEHRKFTRGMVSFGDHIKIHLKNSIRESFLKPIGEVVQGLYLLDYLANSSPSKSQISIYDCGIATSLK